MEKINVAGVDLFFDEQEKDACEPVSQTIEHAVGLMKTQWQLEVPEETRVYIMTSWVPFVFHGPPWPWKILLALSFPFWIFRVIRIWPIAGGWAQKMGKRRVVGVKPPHMLQAADRSMGDKIFVRRDDPVKHVQGITCHELTHAFTAHLRLPNWLNEGLAMIMAEKISGKPTVRRETLEILAQSTEFSRRTGWQKPRINDPDALLYLYIRGYWLTRYIEETAAGLLRDFLSMRQRKETLEEKLAAAYGKNVEDFWREIDRILIVHFTSA